MSPLNLNISSRKFLTAGFSIILFAFAATGCYKATGADQIAAVNLDRSEIKIAEKIPMRVLVSNPWGHQMEYRYTADRGQVIANNGTNSTALYYAPFTGGPDTIRVSIFDRTDNINLPIITNQTFVQGESMSYVELPNTATPLNDADNGLIKVTALRGSIQKKEIGWGRNPTISPDGRYIAYVTYPGDGSSQIIVKDPVGNETNITNHKSFNIDPSWSPIGTDGNLYLVFSSDRISSNSGNTSTIGNVVSGHGERYHLWRTHVNGYDLKQITNTAGNDFQPNWSPDGKSIVFSSDLDNNKSNSFRNIWKLDVQSGKQIQLTHETAPNKGAYNPTWSPDAQKIVYSRKYQVRQEKLSDMQKIWMINFGLNSEGFGQIVTKAFDESIIETYPSWSPDGRTISYVRARGTENAVVSVEALTISNTRGTFAEPNQEGDINNVTEANWARQRSYGVTYPGYNNPFNPTNPVYPTAYPSQYPRYN